MIYTDTNSSKIDLSADESDTSNSDRSYTPPTDCRAPNDCHIPPHHNHNHNHNHNHTISDDAHTHTPKHIAPHYVDEFVVNMMQLMKLNRKGSIADDLKCIQHAFNRIPIESDFNMNHLDWILSVESHPDKTPFQIVLDEEERVVQDIRQCNEVSGVSAAVVDASLQLLYEQLDHWQQLKTNPLCREDKHKHDQKIQIQEVLSLLPRMKIMWSHFHKLLNAVQFATISDITVEDKRWAALLSHSQSGGFSYKFCNRILQASYRLIYIIQTNVKLNRIVQESSFKWSELCREEADAILYNTFINTFPEKKLLSDKDELTADYFISWMNGLKESNKDQVWECIQSTLKKKYDSHVFKEHYGFVRSAFRQKQVVRTMPSPTAESALTTLSAEIKALQEQLTHATSSKERYQLRHVKLKSVDLKWKEAIATQVRAKSFPYNETECKHHFEWLKDHPTHTTILDLFAN